MRPTLYAVMKNTIQAAAELRASGLVLAPDVDLKLARVEAALDRAVASSPDGATIAQAEELVAVDALSDLHLAAQTQAAPIRARLRVMVDEWIAHAARTGVTAPDLSGAGATPSPLDSWLDAEER